MLSLMQLLDIKTKDNSSGPVAQLVRVLSPYAKVAGLIPGQGTCKNQPMNSSMGGTAISVFLSVSLSPSSLLSLSLRLINFFKNCKVKNNKCLLFLKIDFSGLSWFHLILNRILMFGLLLFLIIFFSSISLFEALAILIYYHCFLAES